jgi:hypothetical protein
VLIEFSELVEAFLARFALEFALIRIRLNGGDGGVGLFYGAGLRVNLDWLTFYD